LHGIRLSGPPLGRRPKDAAIHRSQIKQWREDERIRNAVEGKFGEGKLAYGLDRIRTKLRETSETTISLVFLVMNLQKLLREEAASCAAKVTSWLFILFGENQAETIDQRTLCCYKIV